MCRVRAGGAAGQAGVRARPGCLRRNRMREDNTGTPLPLTNPSLHGIGVGRLRRNRMWENHSGTPPPTANPSPQPCEGIDPPGTHASRVLTVPKPIYISIYLSIYIYIYISLSLSLYIYIYTYIYIYVKTGHLFGSGSDGKADDIREEVPGGPS